MVHIYMEILHLNVLTTRAFQHVKDMALLVKRLPITELSILPFTFNHINPMQHFLLIKKKIPTTQTNNPTKTFYCENENYDNIALLIKEVINDQVNHSCVASNTENLVCTHLFVTHYIKITPLEYLHKKI